MSKPVEIAAHVVVLVCGSVLFVGQVLDGHVVRSALWAGGLLAFCWFLRWDVRTSTR